MKLVESCIHLVTLKLRNLLKLCENIQYKITCVYVFDDMLILLIQCAVAEREALTVKVSGVAFGNRALMLLKNDAEIIAK